MVQELLYCNYLKNCIFISLFLTSYTTGFGLESKTLHQTGSFSKGIYLNYHELINNKNSKGAFLRPDYFCIS